MDFVQNGDGQRLALPNFKIDQVAYIAKTDGMVEQLKARFELQDADWVEDEVLAVGRVRGELGANRAILRFNYDLGIELEILQYIEGPNYAEQIGNGQLCHLGMHWDGNGDKPVFGSTMKDPIQDVQTVTHTNPFLLKEGRHYRYTIYDTLSTQGVYMKVIERLNRPQTRPEDL